MGAGAEEAVTFLQRMAWLWRGWVDRVQTVVSAAATGATVVGLQSSSTKSVTVGWRGRRWGREAGAGSAMGPALGVRWFRWVAMVVAGRATGGSGGSGAGRQARWRRRSWRRRQWCPSLGDWAGG